MCVEGPCRLKRDVMKPTQTVTKMSRNVLFPAQLSYIGDRGRTFLRNGAQQLTHQLKLMILVWEPLMETSHILSTVLDILPLWEVIPVGFSL
jgi:hypothetical protein